MGIPANSFLSELAADMLKNDGVLFSPGAYRDVIAAQHDMLKRVQFILASVAEGNNCSMAASDFMRELKGMGF